MSCNKCQPTPCSPPPCIEDHSCECPVFITTDCSTLSEDLECSGIAKGQTETEVLKQLDAYICSRFESVENFFQLVNVGNGSQIYKGISVLGKKELRTLISDGTVTITQNADTISFSVPSVDQNNFVRQLLINQNNLPINYTSQDIADYILGLPSNQRTILDTDSKWNVIIFEASS